jgi:hypothetical protein
MAIKGKLTAEESATGQNKFGRSLAVSNDGNLLIVGVPQPLLYVNQVPNPSCGLIKTFTSNANVWESNSNIANKYNSANYETYEYFNYGHCVDWADNTTSNTLVVGSRHATVANIKLAGEVLVYKDGNSTPVSVTANDKSYGDRFGTSVAISSDENVLVVGAPGVANTTTSNVGAAYVFFKNYDTATSNTTPWIQQAKYDANTFKASNIFFGNSVAVSGDGSTIVIGASGCDSNNNSNIGRAFLLTYDAATTITGNIAANVLTANAVSGGNITVGQYISGSNALFGTKVTKQLSSSETNITTALAGTAGANTILINSNVSSIAIGYNVRFGATSNTSNTFVSNGTTVTNVIGNVVYLSSSLIANAITQSVWFELTYQSTVQPPYSANTLYVNDYSNVDPGYFIGTTSNTIVAKNYNQLTLSTSAAITMTSFRKPNLTGTYEVTPNNTTNSNVTFSSYSWKPSLVTIDSPSEIKEGFFGDSVAISNAATSIVIGSKNGAFVYDSNGTIKTTLSSASQKSFDQFGRAVAINKAGNTIVVGSPNKTIAVVPAGNVYTDGIYDYMYEITTKGTADWANLGVMSSNITVANITSENGMNVVYVTKCVDYVNSNANVGVARVPYDAYITIPGLANTTLQIVSQLGAVPNGNASSNSPWRFSVDVKYTDSVHGNIYTVSNVVSTVSAVYSTDGNINNANIIEGTRFLATNTTANANIGSGSAISYSTRGIANTGAIFKFTSSDDWATWKQVRTCVVESENTRWNKLGSQVAVTNDGNTIFGTSTGVEFFGRTNEGVVYVFDTK